MHTFMSERSTLMPACGVMVWPSRDVPPAYAVIGTLCRRQAFTTATTSSVDLLPVCRVQGYAHTCSHLYNPDTTVAQKPQVPPTSFLDLSETLDCMICTQSTFITIPGYLGCPTMSTVVTSTRAQTRPVEVLTGDRLCASFCTLHIPHSIC